MRNQKMRDIPRELDVRSLSKEVMIKMLQDKAGELGYIPTAASIAGDSSMPSARTYARRFGTWRKALESAGLKRDCESSVSRKPGKEAMIKMLQDKAKEIGHTPTHDDMKNRSEDMPSARTYIRHFGSWNNALEAAGLELNRITNKSKN